MIDKIDWNKVNGLLPVILQDANAGVVLMLGYMNREALEITIKEGIVTFYSRTRKCLWKKGQNSGNYLNVKQYSLDCDNDTLLILVNYAGKICHRDTPSCFDVSFQNNSHNPKVELNDVLDILKTRVEK